MCKQSPYIFQRKPNKHIGLILEPGDVVITGTPAGVGYARTPPVFMKPGDICEIEIENIGILINSIEDQH